MPELKAILWDHDGTLAETEPYWIEAELELCRKFGVPWKEEDVLKTVGSPMREAAQRMQTAGVDMEIDDIVVTLTDRVIELMDEKGIIWMPGVQRLFTELKDTSIRCAVVSNAWRSVVEKTVSYLPEGVIEFILPGDDMIYAKPHPWPYAHAAEVLGVPIENCLAVEDSLVGTLSAEAAGMPVLVVRGVAPVEAGPHRSRVIDLSDITIDSLQGIVDGNQLELAEVAE